MRHDRDLDRVARPPLGEIAREGRRLALRELQRKYPGPIGDVRGLGLMQGIELVGDNKTPDAKLCARIMEETRRLGVLIGKGGLWGNVLRIAPPLTATKSDIDELVGALDGAFAAATGKPGRA